MKYIILSEDYGNPRINIRTDSGSLHIIGENDDIKIFALDTDEVYDIMIQGTGEGEYRF